MIAVVGGGLSGLALSRELDLRGLDHVVLEAGDRAGGIVRSGRVRDRVLEWGPQRTRLTQPLRELVAELGIENQLIAAPDDLSVFVYARGRLRRVPTTAREVLRSDLLGWRTRMRMALEPLTGGLRPDETAGAFLIRKFGREAYDDMLGPLYGGLYASRPTDMPARFALARTLSEFGVGRSVVLWLLRRSGEVPAACSFRDGMQTLTDALARSAGSRLALREAAGTITREGAELVVGTAGGPVRCRAVVLTLPADVAGGLVARLDPEVASRLGRLRYNPLAVVHLLAAHGADADAAGSGPRGLGYQVSFREPLATRGVTWNDALFPGADRAGVYTAYLGGAAAPDVVGLPDDRLGALASEEFERVTGLAAEPISVARTRMPAWDHSWNALDGLRWPEGVHACANWESRPGVPGRLAQARAVAASLAETLKPGSGAS